VNQRLFTIGMVLAVIMCAVVVGALIGGITQPRFREVQGISDESLPAATAATTATPSLEAPTIAPTRESPPTATVAPTRESPPTATVAPTPSAPPAAPTATPATPRVITYTVQPGDILNRIARDFNTTAEAIIELNPGINPDSLRIGEVLQIPVP
jgi:LysM repeat protein